LYLLNLTNLAFIYVQRVLTPILVKISSENTQYYEFEADEQFIDNFTNSSTSSAHVLVKIRNNSVIVVKENESPIYIENSTHVTSYDTYSIYFNPDYYDYVPDKQGLYTKFIISHTGLIDDIINIYNIKINIKNYKKVAQLIQLKKNHFLFMYNG